MKLGELLGKLNSEEIVFIGSRSAFFFIGLPEEFKSVQKELNKNWHKNFSKTVSRFEQIKVNWEKQKPKAYQVVKRKVMDVFTNKTVEKIVPYEERLATWNTRYQEICDGLDQYKVVVDNWTDFENREVKRCYRNIDNNATVIIVDGYEVARFWFKSEYDDFKKDKQKDKNIGYSRIISE